jgi:hypothetical protein
LENYFSTPQTTSRKQRTMKTNFIQTALLLVATNGIEQK